MQVFLREYGTSATIQFVLYDKDAGSLKTNASFVFGDVVISKDGSAETQVVSLPVDEGRSYRLNLTSIDLTAKRIIIFVADQSLPKEWIDTSFVIETYGHQNAMHPSFGDGVLSAEVEGMTVSQVLEKLLASATGKIVRTGQLYVYFKQDNTTESFTLSASDSDRMRIP